ncbi:hypothetical protein NBRC116592_17110 [Colwellia sp. KU-HH00111]|uniref:hypothetical protein n=1 Tax=Colwellia sp. KU-HH00111 TaxID=3127652 RepID=UPI0031075E19
MMKKLVSIIGVSSLSIMLAACGDSSEENSNENSGNYIPPSSSVVSGQFFNSNETGKYFSSEKSPHFAQYGQNARHCYQNYNDYYFESDKTMVFGNPDLPPSDFKQAASWVENNFASALTSMGISEQEFFEQRTNITFFALRNLRAWLYWRDINNFTYPNEFEQWNDSQKYDWATKTVKSMSTDDAVNLILSSDLHYSSREELIIEDKIYVCLHENNQPWGWGEGTAMGITIGAESIVTPNNVDKIIQHELIHTIQNVLSTDFDGFKLPRWFSEGQAVYLSGMSVAKKADHNEYDPTLVVYYSDEYGDISLAYEHYALAYQYIKDVNSQTTIITMMKNLKTLTFDYSIQLNSELDEDHNYVEVFNNHMKQQNGSPLTVTEYRDNYHSLMSSYAN